MSNVNTNETALQKIPCGGFQIGDGLSCAGGVLSAKSDIVWAVIGYEIHGGQPEFFFVEDSPIQSFDDWLSITRKGKIVGLKSVTDIVIAMYASNSDLNSWVSFERIILPSVGKIQNDIYRIEGTNIIYNSYTYTLTEV